MAKGRKRKPAGDEIKKAIRDFLITFTAGFLAMILDHLFFG